MSRRSALIANLLLLGFLAAFALLELRDPDLYYRSVQEDQALEWASFWSFFVAGGVFAWAAARQRKMSGALPWFLLGVALFCVFVAMEEISWAQRVFGHRPPEYFLAENYQQELNLHNIASTKLRLLTFRGIVLGYGAVLPLIALLPVARRWLDRLGVVVPPIALAPSMLAMFWLHLTYPWKFTGEVVECGVGFGFLFIALAHAAQFSKERGRSTSWSIVGISGLVVLLAFTTAWWSQNRQAGDPMNLELAEVETESLASDLLDAAEAKGMPSISKCGLHKRVYTVVEDKRSARGSPERC